MATLGKTVDDGGDDLGGTILPEVGRVERKFPIWIAGIALFIMALILFTALESRRQAALVPSVKPRHVDLAAGPQSIPPLFIPPAPIVQPQEPAPLLRIAPAPAPAPNPPPRRIEEPQPRIIYYPQPATPPPPPEAVRPPRTSNDAVLVFDATAGEASGAPAGDGQTAPGDGALGSASVASRARASVLGHRATTVQQGTLIQAVLETALNSTRPGLTRALVTRDVYGSDGTKMLIPKGSRLIGEYKGDLQAGQNRALITWTRLIRPDGVTIALGSPSADPLGRIGVKGKVNNHFFARFGGALLQSSLDVGVALASRQGNSPVIVALPGAIQNSVGPIAQGNQVSPTLKVRQGTTISVFVARDLDFTSVETR